MLAHELAHQLHGDIRRGLLVQGALTLVTFWVASGRARGRAERGSSLDGPADIGGLPLFGLVLLGAGLAALPVANGWSRHVEHAGRPVRARDASPDPRPSSAPWSGSPR